MKHAANLVTPSDGASDTPLVDAWVRWELAWSVMFYFFLLLSMGLTLWFNENSLIERGVVIALTIISGIWHWRGAMNMGWWQAGPNKGGLPTIIYFAVTIGLWYILLSMSDYFYWLLFGLYWQIFAFLPVPWAICANIFLSSLTFYHGFEMWGATPFWDSTFFWIYLIITFSGSFMTLWIDEIVNQSRERKALIIQLEQTQAELSNAERKAGMLAERQRLAREIHDTLAQEFTSIVMHLEAADQALPKKYITVQHHLDQARQTARSSLAEARRVMQNLRPDILERSSLPDAIKRVVERWSQECKIKAQTTITGEIESLPTQIEVTLLRAIQEGLANVRKHAQASVVQVTLSYMGDVLLLDVQDNGIGMAAAGINEREGQHEHIIGGFGLTAMRERVEQIGGSLLIESEPEEGTTLVISIPISDREDLINS